MTLSKLLNLSVPQFSPLSNGIKSENKGFEGWSEQCPAHCKFLISVSFICISLIAKHCLRGCHCSVTKSCPTLWDPVDCSMPSFPVLHYLLEFAQIHVHWISNAIQPSHLLPPSSLLVFKLSPNQGLSKVQNVLVSGPSWPLTHKAHSLLPSLLPPPLSRQLCLPPPSQHLSLNPSKRSLQQS